MGLLSKDQNAIADYHRASKRVAEENVSWFRR